MDLKTYIEDRERRRILAAEIGTTEDYLYQLGSGWRGRKVQAQDCPRYEAATGGLVTCEELRPDLSWQRGEDGAVLGYFVPMPASPSPATTPAEAA